MRDLVRRIKDEDKPKLLTARAEHGLPYLGVPGFYCLLLVTSNGDRVAAPGEYALSFELGDGATSVAMEVKLVGPQVVVEAWPGT